MVYMVNIGDNISILGATLKSLQKYALKIHELFSYLKMEIEIFRKTPKN